MSTITELDVALRRCMADDYSVFISYYSGRVDVTIQKYAHSGTPGLAMSVKAEAPTVAEAFEKAFKNFPENPLDGSTRWANARITADGEFTEVK